MWFLMVLIVFNSLLYLLLIIFYSFYITVLNNNNLYSIKLNNINFEMEKSISISGNRLNKVKHLLYE